jgi:hypothetical protein
MKFIYVKDLNSGSALAVNLNKIRFIESISGNRFSISTIEFGSVVKYENVNLGINSEMLFTDLDDVLDYLNR